jgi:1,4-dihydroxy-2-naphthoate octaprenyltransferase
MGKHTMKDWIFAVRPWSIPASAMPIIVTLAYLFWKEAEINWLYGIWALVGMIIFHLAGNVWSDWFDFRKKVDAEDTFGAKTLTTGMFEPKEIRNLAIGLLAVSVACGLGLSAVTGIELLYIGIAGAVLTVLYPFLKYNALGDLDILLTFAFLPTLGTSFAATGTIDWNVLLIALPVGLITDGILHSNNTRDMVTDKRAEIKTMAMGLGKKVSAMLYGFEMIFPYVWVGIISLLGHMPF